MPLQTPLYNREEIIAKGETGILTPDELLFLCSRTFHYPIALLDMAKGQQEQPKGQIVRTAYNLARFIDTIEDGALDKLADKKLGFSKLQLVLAELNREATPTSLESVLKEKVPELVEIALKGARSDEERVFVQQFRNPPVLAEFVNYAPKVRNSLAGCVGKMCVGMENFLVRGEIQTVRECKDYCYFVAGSVGESLNDIVSVTDGVEFDPDNTRAKALGEYLQLTNIIKGIRKDWGENRIYVPAEIHAGDSMHFLINGAGPRAENARRNCLIKMLDMARENYAKSSEYVSSIPEHLPGYEAFCLIPIIAAEKTLALIERSDAEKVFAGEDAATKIGREEISNIMQFVTGLAKQPAVNRKSWIRAYLAHPAAYGFTSSEYITWASKVLV